MKKYKKIITSLVLFMLLFLLTGCKEVSLSKTVDAFMYGGWTTEIANAQEIQQQNQVLRASSLNVTIVSTMSAYLDYEEETITCEMFEFDSIKESKKFAKFYKEKFPDSVVKRDSLWVIVGNNEIVFDYIKK